MERLNILRCRHRGRGGLAISTATLLVALLVQLACSGGKHAKYAPFDLDPFRALAAASDCARDRNSVFAIDGRYVLWAREDARCADNNYAYRLYGSTPSDLRCYEAAGIVGPRRDCADPALGALLNTAVDHLGAPDLGLGSTHRVQRVPV
jgi:hypothetical protein